MGFGEKWNMANLNWGTGERCQIILGNKGTKTILTNFRDQKAGNKFENNLRNKGTQANI